MNSKKLSAIAYAIGAALFYAINVPCSKLLLNGVSPTMMAALLYLGAGIGVGTMYLFHHKNEQTKERLEHKDLPYTIGMVLLDIIAPILLMLGVKYGTSSNASLLGNFEIVATTFIALLLFKEKVSKRLWEAIGLITLSSMLKVDNLKITARQTREELVKNISFEVGKGETLGLIGESGSGKSLTSKAIMGLLNRRVFGIDGSIRWKDTEILGRKAKLPKDYRGSQIAMITQNPMTAFAPMIRLGRQIEMGFDLKSKQAKQDFCEKLDDSLKKVNLNDMRKIIRSYPDELSGGMLQRVMIAVTMLQKPALIIADECTTAVDSASEYMILRELEQLRKDGMSMIVVTHDFGVAARLCDRVAVMKQGEIIEQGKTLDVFTSPQQDYTKELAGASILFKEDVC